MGITPVRCRSMPCLSYIKKALPMLSSGNAISPDTIRAIAINRTKHPDASFVAGRLARLYPFFPHSHELITEDSFSVIEGGSESGQVKTVLNRGAYAISKKQGRANNADHCFVVGKSDSLYFGVADGRGEKAAPDSREAVDLFINGIPNDNELSLAEQVYAIHEKAEICNMKKGSTFSVVQISGSQLDYAYLGDSPVFLKRSNGEIRSLTMPHLLFLVWFDQLRNGGKLAGDVFNKLDEIVQFYRRHGFLFEEQFIYLDNLRRGFSQEPKGYLSTLLHFIGYQQIALNSVDFGSCQIIEGDRVYVCSDAVIDLPTLGDLFDIMRKDQHIALSCNEIVGETNRKVSARGRKVDNTSVVWIDTKMYFRHTKT